MHVITSILVRNGGISHLLYGARHEGLANQMQLGRSRISPQRATGRPDNDEKGVCAEHQLIAAYLNVDILEIQCRCRCVHVSLLVLRSQQQQKLHSFTMKYGHAIDLLLVSTSALSCSTLDCTTSLL